MTAPELSEAEAAVVARFEAAPYPVEVLEAGRRCGVKPEPGPNPQGEVEGRTGGERSSPGATRTLPARDDESATHAERFDPIAVIRRVEALADEFDKATVPALINEFDRGLIAGYARAAARIRAALTPQADR